MEMIFADAFYFIALLNEEDEFHETAMGLSQGLRWPLVTTDFILVEVADALAGGSRRPELAAFIQVLQGSKNIEVAAASRSLLQTGLELYAARADKQWSLTDCVSFELMRARKIGSALTHDHHFTQAGFRILM